MQITYEMVDKALNAWFASPPSETDQGLERSMKAALEAAIQGADMKAASCTGWVWVHKDGQVDWKTITTQEDRPRPLPSKVWAWQRVIIRLDDHDDPHA